VIPHDDFQHALRMARSLTAARQLSSVPKVRVRYRENIKDEHSTQQAVYVGGLGSHQHQAGHQQRGHEQEGNIGGGRHHAESQHIPRRTPWTVACPG
jgi:hypothetical protein